MVTFPFPGPAAGCAPDGSVGSAHGSVLRVDTKVSKYAVPSEACPCRGHSRVDPQPDRVHPKRAGVAVLQCCGWSRRPTVSASRPASVPARTSSRPARVRSRPRLTQAAGQRPRARAVHAPCARCAGARREPVLHREHLARWPPSRPSNTVSAVPRCCPEVRVCALKANARGSRLARRRVVGQVAGAVGGPPGRVDLQPPVGPADRDARQPSSTATPPVAARPGGTVPESNVSEKIAFGRTTVTVAVRLAPVAGEVLHPQVELLGAAVRSRRAGRWPRPVPLTTLTGTERRPARPRIDGAEPELARPRSPMSFVDAVP